MATEACLPWRGHAKPSDHQYICCVKCTCFFFIPWLHRKMQQLFMYRGCSACRSSSPMPTSTETLHHQVKEVTSVHHPLLVNHRETAFLSTCVTVWHLVMHICLAQDSQPPVKSSFSSGQPARGQMLLTGSTISPHSLVSSHYYVKKYKFMVIRAVPLSSVQSEFACEETLLHTTWHGA